MGRIHLDHNVERVVQTLAMRDIVMAADESPVARENAQWARESLEKAGFAVNCLVTPGEPEAVILKHMKSNEIDLLVMGAYGHSRVRQLIVGSTTTTLLRASPAPVLILR